MYFIFKDFYSPTTIKEFNNKINNSFEEETKDFPCDITDKTSIVKSILYSNVKYFLEPLLEKCKICNIDNKGYMLFEPTDYNLLNYNIYNKGQEYGWHSDGSPDMPFDQKWTLNINLSEKEFEGGDLELFLSKPITINEFRKAGTAIMFESWLQHRVTPITSGERKTLTYWFIGPKFI